MEKIIIFAGTTEGRVLSEGLAKAGIPHIVCVATEYGELIMNPDPLVTVNSGRMDEEQMEVFIKENADKVFDATHPFAVVVTKNIESACSKAGAEYIRVIRKSSSEDMSKDKNIRYFENAEECAKALSETEGNILITTGSKEIATFTNISGLSERIFARVLPSAESIKLCLDAGVPVKNILAMQGPFSAELNRALIDQYKIRCMVTKQSGAAGGFDEKLMAAEKAGIALYVIGRPSKEEGLTVNEVMKQYGAELPIKITLIGCGPGGDKLLTVQAAEAIAEADAVFGSERLVEGAACGCKYPYYLAKDVIPILEEGVIQNAVILFSGDSGFYSGADKMKKELAKWSEEKGMACDIRVLPGVCSLVYLAAAAGESYQDSPFMSLHGRADDKLFDNVIDTIKNNEKTLLLLSGVADLNRLGKALVDDELYDCEVIVGYELSHPEEEVIRATPEECKGFDKKGLYAVMVKNPHPKKKQFLNLHSDEDFLRSVDPSEDKAKKNDAPMTKEMIRHAGIIRLGLEEGSVLYDVGSGSGSVSIEAAMLDPSITVYAIEKKEAALKLTEANVKRFGCRNVKLVPGEAPSAFEGLEPPTHVFIGGSGGNLKDILDEIKKLNENARVVITAISLETIAEVQKILEELKTEDLRIEQLSVSAARKLGNYNMMTAQNPVMIYSFTLA